MVEIWPFEDYGPNMAAYAPYPGTETLPPHVAIALKSFYAKSGDEFFGTLRHEFSHITSLALAKEHLKRPLSDPDLAKDAETILIFKKHFLTSVGFIQSLYGTDCEEVLAFTTGNAFERKLGGLLPKAQLPAPR